MKERPIIMGADSVRSILDGRKTMTRRVVKPSISNWFDLERDGRLEIMEIENKNNEMVPILSLCPYGQIGDRLWVRETWAEAHNWTNDIDAETPLYRACDPKEPIKQVKWKSPIFMPRWASRIFLEITDIRVERVQEITADDCEKEGIEEAIDYMPSDDGDIKVVDGETMVDDYRDLWNSLNAKRGYPWESNPWVWVISFKVLNNGLTWEEVC